MKQKTNEYVMVSDMEILDNSQDRLGFQEYANGLAKVITKCDTPFVLGLYGSWGVGKTSILRLIEKSLAGRAETVWFDAWRYAGSTDIRLALVHAIAAKANEKAGVGAKIVKRLENIDLAGIANLTIGVLFSKPGIDVRDAIKTSTDALSAVESFKSEFEKLVHDFTGNGSRLVIFLDDLDRCSPEAALAVLEAAKLFIGVKNTVFVVGVDREYLLRSVEERYGTMHIEPDAFLDKLIQFGFQIPPLRQQDVAEYIRQIAPPAIAGYAKIIGNAGANPRRIKRCINEFVLQKTLGDARGLHLDERILAKLTVLRMRWAPFYVSLLESETSCTPNSGATSTARGIPLLDEVRESVRTLGPDPTPADLKTLAAANPRVAEILKNAELVQFLAESPVIWRKDLSAYFHFVQSQEVEKESIASPRPQRSFLEAVLDLEDSLKSDLVRKEFFDKLSELQRRVIVYLLGLDGEYRHTPEEVATMFQISTRDVHQVLQETRDAARQFQYEAFWTRLMSGDTHHHVIPDEPIDH